MMKLLLRVAIMVVEGILRSIVQQEQVVDQQATQPIKQISELVKGGSVWRGQGATAFTNEVDSLVVPQLEVVSTNLTNQNLNISRARDIMIGADQNVQKMVNALADQFSAIYS